MTIRVSVVVPTYKRPDLLERCLTALVSQDFPPTDYEVIIADDAASQKTRQSVECWAQKARPAVRYVPVSGTHGPAAARNCGWRQARGRIVAFTDDDCIPAPTWLREGDGSFVDGVAGAWGQLIMPLPPVPSDFQKDASSLVGAEFVTANCFYRRDVLDAVNGFDERFEMAWREDSDLHFSLLERGSRLARADKAVVVHPLRPAGWGISLKQQRKNLYNALLYKKHPSLYRERVQAAPPLKYYFIVACLLAMITSVAAGRYDVAIATLLLWMAATTRFCLQRLRGTLHTPGHVLEMAVTSVLIPPVAIFWRVLGAFKFRVVFF